MSFDFVSRCQIYINYIHIHVNIYVQKSAFERNGKSFCININYSATNKIHLGTIVRALHTVLNFEYHFWARNLKDKRIAMNNEKQTCTSELWFKSCHVNKMWQEHIMLLDEVSTFITWFDFTEIHGDKVKYLVTVPFFKTISSSETDQRI